MRSLQLLCMQFFGLSCSLRAECNQTPVKAHNKYENNSNIWNQYIYIYNSFIRTKGCYVGTELSYVGRAITIERTVQLDRQSLNKKYRLWKLNKINKNY